MRRMIACLITLMLLMTFAFAESETFTMAGCDISEIGHVWENNLFFQRMEEKTGVHFIFQQADNRDVWQQQKTEMFKSGNLPDVFFKANFSVSETIAYYEAGQLIDLRPYLEEYAPNFMALLREHPEWEKAITLPDGAIVALPLFNELQNNNVMWINKTWLDNLGLPMPTTAEELINVLIVFRDYDANRNGNPSDEIPLSVISMWDLRFLGHAFGLVSNDYYLYTDENGNVASILTTDENRAFLEWLHRLWEEKLITADTFVNIDSARIITDKDATMTYGMFLAPTPLTLVPTTGSDEYVALMPLSYNGQQIYRNTLGPVVRGTFAITSNCQNPAALVAWVDYLYTEEGSRLAQAGLEGTEYLYESDGTWNWIAALEEVTDSVLPNATISDGGSAPGILSRQFQIDFGHPETHRIMGEISSFYAYCVEPMPLVMITDDELALVTPIHNEIARYAEDHMVYFVTGDIPLNDETWAEFCQTVNDKGNNDLIAAWQEIIR